MIDWHSVDTVLLDMDGTLLDLEFDNWFWQKHVPECYARQQGLDRAEADRIIHDWAGLCPALDDLTETTR